ncbi:MAG TPA: porin [Candidatus Wujingus californicus]|uniref:porin n=1 Tax=Candidatus Wujingus californicus TaxID=3367618 RepID=UPI001DF21EA6|nr:porin [Planctomycetota bacterium]MDO8132506.1 porin [Candidatus Brocadiales bacterium]
MYNNKWYKYILSSAIIICSMYINSTYNTFAQETTQTREISKSEREDLQWQLKQMEGAMQKQQEQIHALKNRIEALSAEPKLITREEIQHEIEDYLSTDEARKEMGLGLPSVTAVYTPDDEKYALSFRLPDDNYTLNLGGRLQFQYTFKDKDEDFDESDVQDINLRRARVYMGGNIYTKFIHYYVELDGDKFNVGLRDFYIYVTPIEELNGKFGYFKVPFNRQRMTTSGKLLFIDRSIANDEFTQDRDYGVDIYGKPFEGHIEYHAAVFQGAGEDPEKWDNGDNLDNKLLYVLNFRYNPFGKYDYYDETDVKYSDKLKATIGASVAFNGKVNDEKIKDTNTVVGVVDLGVRYKGFTWDSDYFVRTEDPESDGDTVDSDGFYTQAGYFVIPKKLEVAARYSMLDPNNDINNDVEKEYTAGVNYYFRAHRSKIQADVGYYVTDSEDQDKEENRIRIQYQIIF